MESTSFRCGITTDTTGALLRPERGEKGGQTANDHKSQVYGPGVKWSGETREEAVIRVKALASRVLAERLEGGEATPLVQLAFHEAA